MDSAQPLFIRPTFDVVVIGHIGWDSTTTPMGKNTVRAGSAFYTMVGAACYSRRVGVVSRVGPDFDVADLARIVSVAGIQVVSSARSSLFVHVYSSDYTTRTFRAELGAGAGLEPQDIPQSYLNSRFIHIATMPPAQQERFIKFLRPRSSASISIDTLEQYIEAEPAEVAKVLALADMVFVNRREIALLRTLAKRNLMIKKGEDGADLVIDEDLISEPAPRTTVVDPTGSGDVLAGALLANLANVEDRRLALRRAINLASYSISEFGVEHIFDQAAQIASATPTSDYIL